LENKIGLLEDFKHLTTRSFRKINLFVLRFWSCVAFIGISNNRVAIKLIKGSLRRRFNIVEIKYDFSEIELQMTMATLQKQT